MFIYFQGLRTTLAILDEELPRTGGSVSNRQELMHRLHVEQLVKKNKVRSKIRSSTSVCMHFTGF